MIIIRNMTRPSFFAIATLTPTLLLAIAALTGGIWVWLSVLHITVLVALIDRLAPTATEGTEFPAGDTLSVTLALGHFVLIILTMMGLTGDVLTTAEKIGLFFAAGLTFGQISNANAHELIHRSSRALHRLGMWVYVSLLFGHHTSAHLLVHHRHVATPNDPNTSRRGESFYRYAWRAWTGSFCAGWHAERKRDQQRPIWRNPYLAYVGGALAILLTTFTYGGLIAVILYVLLAGHAQMQLLMSDYVQHYGLTRQITDGKPEPVGARHSWNSPHLFSSAMMLNATRHSDHHTHPARPYPALTLSEDAPMLPKPLPLMASIALIPPLWRRMMDPAVDRWQHA